MDAMTLSVGTRLGSYEIIGVLGAGGMGEVYRARDSRLDRDVAIKVLPAHVAGDRDLKQRFEREAKTLAALKHPHICDIYDVGRQESSPGAGRAIDFLVMEYLEGETWPTGWRRGRCRSIRRCGMEPRSPTRSTSRLTRHVRDEQQPPRELGTRLGDAPVAVGRPRSTRLLIGTHCPYVVSAF